jgi:hypothetical protein
MLKRHFIKNSSRVGVRSNLLVNHVNSILERNERLQDKLVLNVFSHITDSKKKENICFSTYTGDNWRI